MNKAVLAIGGSRFVGRVFSIEASKSREYDLHVVNRGNFPLELDRVSEYKCDRHSPRMISRLVPDISYDALVDFCAYKPGEIKSVIDALGKRIKQYIFISTVKVYVPDDSKCLTEEDCVIDISGGAHTAKEYERNKLALEYELISACETAGIKYTILRPTFIYGPFNYSLSESFFIELIARKHTVPVPVDADSHFNFVYVIDVAHAIMACIGEPHALDQIFNLSAPEILSFPQLISDFERYNAGPFDIKELTLREIEEQRIVIPFPLRESLLYSGEKLSKSLNFEYTPYSEGMEKTFKLYYSLYLS